VRISILFLISPPFSHLSKGTILLLGKKKILQKKSQNIFKKSPPKINKIIGIEVY
jgi:hypothetical protein